VKGALTTGSVLSLLAVSAWSVSTVATAPATPQLHLDWRHHFLASYMALAGAPTGNAAELFAVVAFIYALCLFCAGMRARGRRNREDVRAGAGAWRAENIPGYEELHRIPPGHS
jgi:alkylhydroperoxidase family enzyme